MIEAWSVVTGALVCACLHVDTNGFVLLVGCTVIMLMLSSQPNTFDFYDPNTQDSVSARAAKVQDSFVVDAGPKKQVEKVANPRMIKKAEEVVEQTTSEGETNTSTSCVYAENNPLTGPRHWAAVSNTGRRTKDCQNRLREKIMEDFFQRLHQYK